MNAQDAGLLLQILGGFGALGWVGSYFMERRRQRRADTLEPMDRMVDAAVQLVEPMRAQIGSLNERVALLERQAAVHRRVLAEHAQWDHLALVLARENGISLELPPPLFPLEIT